MGDPGATQLLAQMSCLPPRPITCVDDEKLYLLPLVDARYWWQFEHVDLSITAASTTWANVITSIGTGIGGTITVGTVSADYFRPDPTELTRKYDNAALLLDAVAHTLGMRVVVTLAGAVSLQSFATAGEGVEPVRAAMASSQASRAADVPLLQLGSQQTFATQRGGLEQARLQSEQDLAELEPGRRVLYRGAVVTVIGNARGYRRLWLDCGSGSTFQISYDKITQRGAEEG